MSQGDLSKKLSCLRLQLHFALLESVLELDVLQANLSRDNRVSTADNNRPNKAGGRERDVQLARHKGTPDAGRRGGEATRHTAARYLDDFLLFFQLRALILLQILRKLPRRSVTKKFRGQLLGRRVRETWRSLG